MTVMRSYMELNRDMFEKLSATNHDENKKEANAKLQSKWETLEKKLKI